MNKLDELSETSLRFIAATMPQIKDKNKHKRKKHGGNKEAELKIIEGDFDPIINTTNNVGINESSIDNKPTNVTIPTNVTKPTNITEPIIDTENIKVKINNNDTKPDLKNIKELSELLDTNIHSLLKKFDSIIKKNNLNISIGKISEFFSNLTPENQLKELKTITKNLEEHIGVIIDHIDSTELDEITKIIQNINETVHDIQKVMGEKNPIASSNSESKESESPKEDGIKGGAIESNNEQVTQKLSKYIGKLKEKENIFQKIQKYLEERKKIQDKYDKLQQDKEDYDKKLQNTSDTTDDQEKKQAKRFLMRKLLIMWEDFKMQSKWTPKSIKIMIIVVIALSTLTFLYSFLLLLITKRDKEKSLSADKNSVYIPINRDYYNYNVIMSGCGTGKYKVRYLIYLPLLQILISVVALKFINSNNLEGDITGHSIKKILNVFLILSVIVFLYNSYIIYKNVKPLKVICTKIQKYTNVIRSRIISSKDVLDILSKKPNNGFAEADNNIMEAFTKANINTSIDETTLAKLIYTCLLYKYIYNVNTGNTRQEALNNTFSLNNILTSKFMPISYFKSSVPFSYYSSIISMAIQNLGCVIPMNTFKNAELMVEKWIDETQTIAATINTDGKTAIDSFNKMIKGFINIYIVILIIVLIIYFINKIIKKKLISSEE